MPRDLSGGPLAAIVSRHPDKRRSRHLQNEGHRDYEAANAVFKKPRPTGSNSMRDVAHLYAVAIPPEDGASERFEPQATLASAVARSPIFT